jgi:hypothetical protein
MQPDPNHPLCRLAKDDQDLVLELVLRGGSLKEVAEAYGVSYPTIRVRIDRLIERLRGIVDGRRPDAVAELLARLVERGEISMSNARALRELVERSARAQSTPGGES